jgi:hypothetical protein
MVAAYIWIATCNSASLDFTPVQLLFDDSQNSFADQYVLPSSFPIRVCRGIERHGTVLRPASDSSMGFDTGRSARPAYAQLDQSQGFHSCPV